MAIYQRGNIWWVNLYRPGRPRLRVSTGSESRADALAIEATLRRAEHGDPRRARLVAALDNIIGTADPGGLPLAAAWASYASLPDIRPGRHLRHRESHLAAFVAWAADHWPAATSMAAVSRQCATAYLDSIRRSGATGKTANNIRSDLSAVWQALLVRAELPENVWRAVPTAPTVDSRQRRAFTPDEEARILAAARERPPWDAVCIVARYTGLRRGDILGMRWSDLDGDLIRLTPAKTARHKVKVAVPIHPRVREVLGSICRNVSKTDLIFPGLATAGSERRGAFAAILRAAGVEPGAAIVDFHSWRHTFRTRLKDAGVSDEVCNRLGGWSEDGAGQRYDHSLEPLRAAILSLK